VTITTEAELVIEVTEEVEATTDTSSEEDSASVATSEPEVEIERNSYKLVIGANLEDGYVAKRDESDYYVLLSTFNAEDFVTKSQENFIVQDVEETTE